MPANNATLHALLIPEILGNIFQHADNANLAQISQVCKVWSDVALAALWCDAENLHHLFSVLSPLHIVEEPLSRNASKYVRAQSYKSCKLVSYGAQHFRECPSTSDWQRFEKYTSLV